MERLENMIAARSVENIEIVKMGKETGWCIDPK